MIIFVGSTNPVKINAVKLALTPQFEELEVIGFSVPTGVREQPMSDEETRRGAVNRAKNALNQGIKSFAKQKNKKSEIFLGIGLEGGVSVEKDGEDEKMWETVWAAVVDEQSNCYLSSGGKFIVPDFLAEQILQGAEMGPVMSSYYGGRSVKTQEGLVGAMTKKFVDRTSMYAAIARIAIGQWYGRGWEKELNI